MVNGFLWSWFKSVGYRCLIKGQPVDSRYIRVHHRRPSHSNLERVSVYKTAVEETDGYPLGLTYHSDRTADTNDQWNEEGEGVRGTSMWTKERSSDLSV